MSLQFLGQYEFVIMYVCMYVYVNGCVLSIYDDLFVAVHLSYMHV